jgi:short-subunit dehydrogenase
MILITGASTGIGLESARILSTYPNTYIILSARTLAKV